MLCIPFCFVQKHDIPVSAIPCLQYTKELKKMEDVAANKTEVKTECDSKGDFLSHFVFTYACPWVGKWGMECLFKAMWCVAGYF